MGDFTPDFSDSVLIHRSCIEELNSQIKVKPIEIGACAFACLCVGHRVGRSLILSHSFLYQVYSTIFL